jgi:hypothetical protein
MPLTFARSLSLEERSVGVPVKKTPAVTTINNQKEALIGIPSLGARILMSAVSALAGQTFSHGTFGTGHTHEGNAEGWVHGRHEVVRQVHPRRENELSVGERFRQSCFGKDERNNDPAP